MNSVFAQVNPCLKISQSEYIFKYYIMFRCVLSVSAEIPYLVHNIIYV